VQSFVRKWKETWSRMGKIKLEFYLEEGKGSLHLAYDRDQWRTLVNTVMNLVVQ
jgi:hypothetical protein